MAEIGKTEKRLPRFLALPSMQKVAGLINKLILSRLGVRVVSVYAVGIDKNWFDRMQYFQRLFDMLKGVEGDVVECGVATGTSLAMLANLVRSSRENRHIWGFDNWTGLPEPGKEDLTSKESIAKKSMFGAFGQETVLVNLRYYGFNDSEISEAVTLVKGLFSDTLPEYKGTKIAFLHIDADLYASYIDALRYLWPKINTGGIVAFDEYQQTEYWPGAKQAVDEFLSGLPSGSVKLEKDALFNRYYVVKTT